jgi:hypothetical protein
MAVIAIFCLPLAPANHRARSCPLIVGVTGARCRRRAAVHRTVAGLDIAKAEVEVTIRVPSDTGTGRRQQETRAFGTTRRELLALADWLRCWGVTKIGMEGTGVIRGTDGTVCNGK